VEGISSDLEQNKREEILNRFRAKKTRVVVATDVLSRGIDIKDISLVINYNVPGDGEDYVHRIGRTARADASGMAITLINEDEMYKFAGIEKLIGNEINKIQMPPHIGVSPEWNTSRSTRGNRSRGPVRPGQKEVRKTGDNRPKAEGQEKKIFKKRRKPPGASKPKTE
jgi:superfamily II DNA/RNA helicase